MSPETTVEIVPEAGLHARPAAKFVEAVQEYDADVEIGPPDGDLVPAASMIAITSLGVGQGDELRIIAEGSDAEAALDELADILTTPEAELS